MEIVSDMNVLYDAFKASMKGSSWKEEPQRFEMDFLSEIVRLKHELESKEYHTTKGSEFILNERGKIRYVHGGRMRDRVVRHALCDKVLGPSLQPFLIFNNGASQKGKGVSFSRKIFERDLHNYWLENRTNEGYIGFVDLSKFYDNIPHEKAQELIRPKIDDFSAWLLEEIMKTFRVDVSYMSDEEYAHCMEMRFDSVRYQETVPTEARTGRKWMAKSVEIGDQVSQDVGVFYPTRIDNYAKIVRGVKRYGRYMDDLYVIAKTREEVCSVLDGIREQAKMLGLFVNEKKTRIVRLSQRFKYLQVKYWLSDTGQVVKRISPKSVSRERRKLKAYKRLLDRGRMSYEMIEQSYKSWMGMYTHIISKKQVKSMKRLYKHLFGKETRWKTRPTR